MFLDKVLDMIGKRFFEESRFSSDNLVSRMKDSELNNYLFLSQKSFENSIQKIKQKTKNQLALLDKKYQEKKSFLNQIEKNINRFRVSIEEKKEENKLEEVRLKLLESLLLFKEAKQILGFIKEPQKGKMEEKNELSIDENMRSKKGKMEEMNQLLSKTKSKNER